MLQSSTIYTDVEFSCGGYHELWTVNEAEKSIHSILGCDVITEIRENDMDPFMPYGWGSQVIFTTRGMNPWDQKLIEKAAKAIESYSLCKIEAYTLGSMSIKVYETPERTDLMFLMPEQFNEIITKRKEEWLRTHPKTDT